MLDVIIILKKMLYQARVKHGRPKGFSRKKKIPYQAPLTQLGPQKCTFWKNANISPNINATILIFFGKLKELPGATHLCFAFTTTVPKFGTKTVQSSKNAEK